MCEDRPLAGLARQEPRELEDLPLCSAVFFLTWISAVARIGFHASHEQFPPSELLRLVQEAEAAGFDCAMSSDHFRPWGPAQGHSGYAWAWLGLHRGLRDQGTAAAWALGSGPP